VVGFNVTEPIIDPSSINTVSQINIPRNGAITTIEVHLPLDLFWTTQKAEKVVTGYMVEYENPDMSPEGRRKQLTESIWVSSRPLEANESTFAAIESAGKNRGNVFSDITSKICSKENLTVIMKTSTELTYSYSCFEKNHEMTMIGITRADASMNEVYSIQFITNKPGISQNKILATLRNAKIYPGSPSVSPNYEILPLTTDPQNYDAISKVLVKNSTGEFVDEIHLPQFPWEIGKHYNSKLGTVPIHTIIYFLSGENYGSFSDMAVTTIHPIKTEISIADNTREETANYEKIKRNICESEYTQKIIENAPGHYSKWTSCIIKNEQKNFIYDMKIDKNLKETITTDYIITRFTNEMEVLGIANVLSRSRIYKSK
jgi:hypothetical protein